MFTVRCPRSEAVNLNWKPYEETATEYIWRFEKAKDVALFMWAKSRTKYKIFKGDKLIESLSHDIKSLENLLNEY